LQIRKGVFRRLGLQQVIGQATLPFWYQVSGFRLQVHRTTA
jgi:hypothetical protein